MEKRDDGYNQSESGNWNVAAQYSSSKIMRNLYLADEYSNIAIFGYSSLVDELQNPIPKDVLMIKGFERLVNCLILIIDNSLFAVKKDKEVLVEFKKKLKKVEALMPLLSEKVINHRKRTSKIEVTDKYKKVLDIVLEIKAGINEPLNKNHLIFTDKEEFDPKKFKNDIKERMRERG